MTVTRAASQSLRAATTAMAEADLDHVLPSYLALVPPTRIFIPSEIPFEKLHRSLLEKILLLAHANPYPPSPDYQQAFWKWAINLLEGLIANDTVRHQHQCIR